VSPVTSSGAAWFGAEALNLANLYEEFRCVGLDFELLPPAELHGATGNDSTSFGICWRPMTQTAPANMQELVDSFASATINSNFTQPGAFKLGPRDLQSSMLGKWLHVDSTPSVAEVATQGRIYYIANGTNSTTMVQEVIVSSTWEFRGLVPFGSFLSRIQKLDDLSRWLELKASDDRKASTGALAVHQHRVKETQADSKSDQADGVNDLVLVALPQPSRDAPSVRRSLGDLTQFIYRKNPGSQ
jgi:hypothetical protein